MEWKTSEICKSEVKKSQNSQNHESSFYLILIDGDYRQFTLE